jgi:flagellar hook-associated protein 2
MATSSTITLSGSSTYSSDFQTVLNHAVTVASQPMIALQADVSTLQSQQSAIAQLDSTFINLQSAIGAVSNATTGTPGVSTGGSSAVSVSATSAALPGSYTIQVNNLGSSTTTMSEAGLTTVADPSATNISSSGQFTLTVNGVAKTISPSGSTLSALVTAINNSNDGVQATTVNVGSNSSPDYRLAITSSSLAPDTIQLNDGTQDLLDTLSTGANAQYTVNGQSTAISSNSRQVTLSTGLTLQLSQQTSSPVTVTVSQSYTGLQTALSNLATAYNSAASALAQNRGSAGGPLQGDQIIYSLTSMLQNMTSFSTGNSGVGSLADLGLTLDETGQMSFDSSAFSAASTSAIQTFLGTTSTGGFLQSANNDLLSMTDSNTGILQAQATTLQTQVTSDNNQIATDQSNITDLQTNLQQQLSAADAAIATLQAQTSYFQQLFTATYGNGTSSPTG